MSDSEVSWRDYLELTKPTVVALMLLTSAIGMFLSVPIMVMLLVVCSHVPALRPIAILLSRQGLPESEKELDESAERDLFSQIQRNT